MHMILPTVKCNKKLVVSVLPALNKLLLYIFILF